MATDQAQSGEAALEIPDLPVGTLIGTEVSYRPALDFTEEEKNALRELCRVVQQRDMPARREQVIRVWEKRLFDRGHQHLLPRYTGGTMTGFALPTQGTGYGPGEADSRSIFETNIYNSYSQIIISALTREVPSPRFEPRDPNNDADITAAETAEKLKKYIERNNKMKSLMAEMSRFLWTDGLSVFFSRYVKDGQRFGYEEPHEEELEDETVPEDEEAIAAQEEQSGVAEAIEGEEEPGSNLSSGDESDGSPNAGREPRGREVIEVGGALEWKFPIKEDWLANCSYAQNSHEIDLQIARARYPQVAEKVKAWQGGPGGDDIDRLARINTRLGVMDNYLTTDSAAYDVTEQTTWFRTCALLEVKVKEVRESLIQKAGEDGLRVVFCGETFCEGRQLSMDDQLTLVHALPGDGMNRPGLGDWLVPIQKVLNNWMELADDYFIRGVPNKWMDNEMFDVEKIRDQVNMVGAIHPFDREEGVTMEQVVWEETPISFPPQLSEFIGMFQEGLPQLLCGAFPALSGGGDSSPTDTYGGMLVQRDQAIGRIGIPWRHIKEGIACVFRQAIACLAHNHDKPIDVEENRESLRIEMEDLKGEFLAFPETDENFPESPTQKTNRVAVLMADAATNPYVAQLMDTPDNLEIIKNASGLEDLIMPALEARDKQLGENVLLLKSGPTPNPQIMQAKLMLAELAQQGPAAAPQMQALMQQVQALPPQVSSVEIDEECDDHATEAATALRVLNSPRGRSLKHGDEDEQAAFQNLRLHYLEHKAALAKQQANMPPAKGKPPSISIALKDLPPKEAAAAASMAGIPATPQDFEQEEVAETVSKHPGSVTVQ